MKYRPLTKEQFESLHKEFATFLAHQGIDKNEWEALKKESHRTVEEEMNVFSDIVWDDVLTRTEYIEHFSPQSINLFKCGKEQIQRIVIEVDHAINLLEQEGYEWLLKNVNSNSIHYLQGTKSYTNDRNAEIFELIEKGAVLSKGELFTYFQQLLP